MESLTILVDLARNVCVFLVLIALFGQTIRHPHHGSLYNGLCMGLAFSLAAASGMLMGVELFPGMVIDGRLIMTTLAAAYGGPIAGAVCLGSTVALRALLGGAGMACGIGGIIGAASNGLLFWWLHRHNSTSYRLSAILLLGLVTSGQALAQVFLFFPTDRAVAIAIKALPAAILVTPIGCVLVAYLLNHQVHKAHIFNKLRRDEHRYRSLFDTMVQGAFYKRADGTVEDCNQASLDLLGLSREQFLDQQAGDEQWLYFDNDGTRIEAPPPSSQALVNGQAVRNVVAKVFNPRRNYSVWLAVNAIPQFKRQQTQPYRTFITLHDITDRWRKEQVMAARLRLSELSLDSSMSEVLRKTIDEAEVLTDSTLGFFHFYTEETQSITLQMWSSRTLSQFDLPISGGHNYSLKEAGIWADAIRNRHPTIHNSYSAKTRPNRLPKGHPDILREMVIPIIRAGKVVAVLGVGNKPTDYTEHEVSVLTELADLACDIVFRKRSEELVQAGEARFQRIVDTANEAIIEVDAQFLVVFANPAASQMLGYSQEELLGKPAGFFVHPEESDDHASTVTARRQGKNQRYERRILTRNGEERWILVSATPQFDQEKRFAGSLAMFIDITEQKHLSSTIQSLEHASSQVFGQEFMDTMAKNIASTLGAEFMLIAKLRQAESLTAVTLSCYAQGEIVQNFEYQLAGGPAEHIVGKRACSFVEAVSSSFPGDKLLQELQIEGFVGAPLTHSDNRPLGLLAALYRKPVHNPNRAETILNFFSLRIAGEIERMHAVEQLRENHQRFLTILDGIDISICVADMKSHEILFINRHMRERFGEDLTGRACWQVIHNQSGPCDFCRNHLLQKASGNAGGVSSWERFDPKAGKWYLNFDRAIPWIDGRLVKVQVSTDITRLKEMELERDTQRTQILQLQKLESIGTLAGGIAHDFNNILSAIIGYTEIALDHQLPAESKARNSLNQVLSASQRAKDLVRQILTFSRQSRYEKRPINLLPLIKEVLKLIRATLPSTITIHQELKSEQAYILGDPVGIHQVLLNLCSNAGYAMRDRGGRLTLKLQEVELHQEITTSTSALAPGCYLEIMVEDNGAGMEEAVLHQIFDPFYTTKPKEEGTGLGLSVALGIILEHNGALRAESSPGVGSCFTLLLPKIVADHQNSAETMEEPRRGNEHILLIDDEPSIVNSSKVLLERLGYTVTAQTSSKEGLQIFQANPDNFDLVITDQTMPGYTGVELASRLRSIRPDIPIILCTGYNFGSDSLANPIAVNLILRKPILKAELSLAIQEALAQTSDRN